MPKRDVLGERLLIFHDTLTEIIGHYSPELIAYERPYFPQLKPPKAKVEGEEDDKPEFKISIHNLIFLQKVEGIVELTATRLRLPYEDYASTSWRLTALKMGRAPRDAEPGFLKKAMVRRARQLGYDPKSEDEADAIGILMHALHGEPANKRAQGDLLAMAEEEGLI